MKEMKLLLTILVVVILGSACNMPLTQTPPTPVPSPTPFQPLYPVGTIAVDAIWDGNILNVNFGNFAPSDYGAKPISVSVFWGTTPICNKILLAETFNCGPYTLSAEKSIVIAANGNMIYPDFGKDVHETFEVTYNN